MLRKNKKALSEIVGYTILIVIALSLSVMVYSFLKLYVPKETAECNQEINLIIQRYSCMADSDELNITISNSGLFKVNAAYLRFGKLSGALTQINKEDFLLYGENGTEGLNPQESYSYHFSEIVTEPGEQYRLELQPVVIQNKKLVACENAIVTETIQCN